MTPLRLHVRLLTGHQQATIPTEPLSKFPAILGEGQQMHELLSWKPLVYGGELHQGRGDPPAAEAPAHKCQIEARPRLPILRSLTPLHSRTVAAVPRTDLAFANTRRTMLMALDAGIPV